ncbi:unnamed protein product [Heligmosomoides polygyrus]|uniref:G-protein alpha subunit n=1 Tax=Heligmosomoides polygyrus TaxID=6339 RepID=A0A3P8A765_HELPZ|nr:unnamed protein product [Heligmosomoides polygyrus]
MEVGPLAALTLCQRAMGGLKLAGNRDDERAAVAQWQSSEWGHECQCPKSAEAIVSAVESAGTHPFAMSVPASLKVDLLEVFRDENITATLHIHHRMARKWRIEDGTLKFLSEPQIERLFDENAELTSTDIVHLRYPTTGVQDFRFSIKDTYIQIHDMGGQPTEMMQIPVFMQEWIASDQEGYKNYLLFVTSMADFNVEDEEEPSRTAMERSIRILDRILGVSTINSCGVLIFYNKQDRFDSVVTKLEETTEGRDELIRYLGEALSAEAKRKIKEGSCPLEPMREAIAVKYDYVINQRRKGKRVYARYTQAVDPKIMADIFNMIKSEIIDHYITNITFPI